MNKIQLLTFIFLFGGILACKDQLDIVNPNAPTPESAKNEQGIVALAQGSLYVNGFQMWGNYFALVIGYHESMGDIVGSDIADNYRNQVSCPDKIVLDNGSLLLNPSTPPTQKEFLKTSNNPSTKYNPFLWEWGSMYSLNGAMNTVLVNIELVDMKEAKRNTVKAWAYFWKGFAYSRIGSMYYAGIINDQPFATNNKFVTKEQILLEAESNFAKAEVLLKSLIGNTEYMDVMNQLIPLACKTGKGLPMSADQWLRHINTLRARNILVNLQTAQLTSSDWDKILAYTANGILASDNTFTIRTDELGNLLGSNGYVAAQAIGSNGGGSNKISERFIQDFTKGDKRLSNNFNQISPWIGPGAYGTSFNTRYLLVNKGKGMPGVVVMANKGVFGADEIYIAGTYEENALMQAEASIYKGNLDAGLAKIDEVRNYQGAGLVAVSGTSLSSDQAKEELRRERRVGLAFRGFAFYDARRWGVLKNGRAGCVVVDFDGTVSTNAFIQYGFMDYWDVPIGESFYNAKSSDSAPIENPN